MVSKLPSLTFKALPTLRALIALVANRPGGGLLVAAGHHDGSSVSELALRSWQPCIGVPALYSFRYHVAAGGLASYGTNLAENYRLGAGYVDRILKGEKPGDLPVQAPTRFEFVINSKAAKSLGLEIPPGVLALADEVIE